jgi:hypothetical protein
MSLFYDFFRNVKIRSESLKGKIVEQSTNREKIKNELLQKLNEHREKSQWQDIIQLSETAINEHKNNPNVYFTIALAYYAGQKNLERAEEYTCKGLDYEVNNPLIHMNILILMKQGKSGKAIDFFRKIKSSYLAYATFADHIINNLIYCYLEEGLIQPCIKELEPCFDELETRHQNNFFYNAACLYAQAEQLEKTIHYILLAKKEGYTEKIFLESDDFRRYRDNEVFSFIVSQDYSKKNSFQEFRVCENEFREIKLLNFLPGYRKYKIADNRGTLEEYGKVDHVEEYSEDCKVLIAYAQKREQLADYGFEALSPHEKSWVCEFETLPTWYQNENSGTLPAGLILNWEPNLGEGIYYAAFRNYESSERAPEIFSTYQRDIYDFEIKQKSIESLASLMKIIREWIGTPSYDNMKKESVFYISHQHNEFDFEFAVAVENGQIRPFL